MCFGKPNIKGEKFMKPTVRFLFYFLFILLVGYIYNFGMEFGQSEKVVRNSNLSILYMVAYPVLIGILLGLAEAVERTKIGELQYDWVFALGLGLPLAYITFSPLLIRFNIFPPYFPSFNFPISGILLGYVLIHAIKSDFGER
jgi:uncharacterized membrane protein (DUF485 family)